MKKKIGIPFLNEHEKLIMSNGVYYSIQVLYGMMVGQLLGWIIIRAMFNF